MGSLTSHFRTCYVKTESYFSVAYPVLCPVSGLFLSLKAVAAECIVMIRKSVLWLECLRKLAYVMNALQKNTVKHSFPVLETDHYEWVFFEGRQRLPTGSVHSQRLTLDHSVDKHSSVTL